jgi:mono/diheme cytochrome c family protein
MRRVLVLFGLALAPLPAVGAPALFTAAQAVTGAGMYGQACAGCHGADLRGITGPALVGTEFAAAKDGYTVGLVFNNIWESTPAGAPDSLSKTEYVDIMAYIMARNGLSAGDAALTFAGASVSGVAFYSLVK